jgi:acetyl-CoA synthetase
LTVAAIDCHTPNVIWQPSPEFVESSNVWRFLKRLGFAGLEEFLRFSREETDRFWDEMLRELRVEWFEPYQAVRDTSRGPEWTEWFVGGRLNIAHMGRRKWRDAEHHLCGTAAGGESRGQWPGCAWSRAG